MKVDESPAGVTLTVEGEIDMATVDSLETALTRALADNPRRLAIDLRAVTFIDSSGLKFLLVAHRRSEQQGWELKLLPPPDDVREVFRLTGIDERLLLADGDPE